MIIIITLLIITKDSNEDRANERKKERKRWLKWQKDDARKGYEVDNDNYEGDEGYKYNEVSCRLVS